MSINLVHLVGRAGTEPDIKYFDSAKILCTFPLAVDRRTRKDDRPDWFNLEIWGRTAEIAKDYVRKGSLVGIQGSLKIDTWTDRNTGMLRSKPIIKVDRLDLLGSKRDNESNGMNGYSQSDYDY
ncbi:single-stranded DNA-binding protein [Oscillatoria salina]|uniref:single-stranded DNA-binding protein n=1 Tax=Oscillatoria salina TaxID=331517 RepID=UPI0013BD0869|nr:single-stranded DNA-binding protein [Oscillatoria salina]MBZ8182138.1 single-stranded DNA-binding protein [Oscillatoria salina IIICB1]NET87792.1 single-stranded DNA-binding protein [Kamptonema sp. SIO1D9]